MGDHWIQSFIYPQQTDGTLVLRGCHRLVCYYLGNIQHTTLLTLFYIKRNLNIVL